MDTKVLFYTVLWIWIAIGVIVFILLHFIEAPYGRYSKSKGWGKPINAKSAWFVMESPALLVYLFYFIQNYHHATLYTYIFLALWVVHYGHRAIIYPLTMPKNSKPMPMSIIAMGFVFNTANGYIQGKYINFFAGQYPTNYFIHWNFIVGITLFVVGFAINKHSDAILRKLKRQNNGGYKIPYGGMFRFVSSPNYFGEILEWIGWALATWSVAGLAFAFWTAANLIPRARRHHKWYHQNFESYPKDRKAIFPFIY